MIYHIFANRSNIGDWLSAKGIQKLLYPLEVTECLCDEPFIKDTMDCLSGATENDLIVIGGGGLFMDYFNPFWNAFREVANRVPFCIWGIGYCDLKSESSLPQNNLIEDIIEKSMICIVRDELTRTHLKKINLSSPIPCPSINFINPCKLKGNNLLHVVNYTTAGAKTYNSMCATAKSFSDNTGRIYVETNNLITKNNEIELAKILSLYEKSDIIISSALHGCIIALAMRRKVIVVSGDRKIEAFMESMGLKNWVLDINEVLDLPEHLNQLDAQPDPALMLNFYKKKNEEIALTIKNIIASTSNQNHRNLAINSE
jgi:polysaccharide pyruvyl transferase WcaK-like protein